MSTNHRCALCGAALPDDALNGQCPECLIQLGLAAGAEEASSVLDEPSGPLLRYFGDYELLEEIAHGGMGVVYKARQVSLNRVVAVKMILAGHFAGKDAIARFRKEAESAARLKHPNIVSIHEIGEDDGQPYFSMDYIAGRNLADVVRENPLPARLAAECVQTMARAIQYAHSQGVLHRDLKPANVLLDAEGQPHLTDFGLAKRLVKMDSNPAGSSREKALDEVKSLSADTHLTITGQVLGSPGYMSPEQAAGRRDAIGPAGDLYSLGAILYHLITGRAPFAGASIPETLRQVAEQEPVSPRLLNPSVPRDLETICLKCLEKAPSRRYTTAQELAEELDRFLRDEPIHARPVTRAEKLWRLCRRNPAAAGLAASLVVAMVTGLVAISHQKSELQRNLVRQYVANGTRLMNDGDLFGSLLWYTEGLKLDAGSKRREEPHRIRIRSVLESAPRLTRIFAHGTVLQDAQFSPDGLSVITASDDHTARVWDLETQQERLVLRHEDDVMSAVFSASGRRITTASRDKTGRVWDASTGLPVSPALQHKDVVWQAVLSPDETIVATCSSDRAVQLWNATNGERGLRLDHPSPVIRVIFNPEGRFLGTVTEAGAYSVWEMATGKQLLYRPSGFLFGAMTDLHGFSFSSDGTAVLTCEGLDVRVWNTSGWNERFTPPLRSGISANLFCAAFSPDGKAVLAGGEFAVAQVWDMAAGTPRFHPAGSDSGIVRNAKFSPDSHSFVVARTDGIAQVYDSWTGRELCPPLRHPARLKAVSFHPNSRKLLVHCLDQTARVWDLAPCEQPPHSPWTFTDQRRWMSRDRQLMLMLGPSNTVAVVDTQSLATVRVLAHAAPVYYASFNEDGSVILTTFSEPDDSPNARSNSSLWETKSGRCLSGTNLFSSVRVIYSAFRADGQRLLTCGFDSDARVWDGQTGRAITPMLTHAQRIHWGSFDPSGDYVVTASWDKTVRIWDAATGQPVTAPLQHRERVVCATWSADSRRLYTFLADGRVQLWDLVNGEPLTPPRRARSMIQSEADLAQEFGSSDLHSVQDLKDLASFLAAEQLDPEARPLPLALSDAARTRHHLSDSFPEWAVVTPDESVAWLIGRARSCLRAAEHEPALAHFDEALRIKPGDPDIISERDAAMRSSSAGSQTPFNERPGIPPRDPSAPIQLVDLTRHYTSPLHYNFQNGFFQVSAGLQVMGGTLFDIRGFVQVRGVSMDSKKNDHAPTRVVGIRVGLKCRCLHFLQGTMYDSSDEVEVGRYVLHYGDGETRELPIIHSRDTAGWWRRPFVSRHPETMRVVWTGSNPDVLLESDMTCLYENIRANPRPDIELVSIDFVSSMAFPSPFLVALTVE